MKVAVSRFNASIFEIVHPNGKERAFIRREDPEFIEALQVEDKRADRLAKLPFGLGRLLPPPTLEIADARWHKLRARISGSFPAVKL